MRLRDSLDFFLLLSELFSSRLTKSVNDPKESLLVWEFVGWELERNRHSQLYEVTQEESPGEESLQVPDPLTGRERVFRTLPHL